MTDLLFRVSRTFDNQKVTITDRKNFGLPDEVFDAALIYTEDMIRFSTNHAFK